MPKLYGTATITPIKTSIGNTVYVVQWRNHGNDLRNAPRGFHSESDAREFCRERSLTIVR